MRGKICFMMLSVMVAVSTGFSYDISAYGYESPLQQAYMESEVRVMNGEAAVMDADREVTAKHIKKASEEVDEAIQIQKEEEEQARLDAEAKEAGLKRSQADPVSVGNDERELLARTVMAEAGGEDLYGQIMVANVILNRVRSGYSGGSSISDIIYAPGQFETVSSGAIWCVSPTDSVYEAVDRALAGEDYSNGALYFVSASCDYSWFMSDLSFVAQHGGHMFFK